MDGNPDSPLDFSRAIQVAGLLVALVLIHVIPYLPRFSIPHGDYLYVIHVINNIWSPEWYGGDRLTEFLMSVHTRTAALYYYGLTYPLRMMLPAKWVMLTIGLTITGLSGYFSGYPWRTWRHALVGLFLVVILLTVPVTPLEGNRRSFATFFILGALVLGEDPHYPFMLVLTALAGGIYPPMSLVLIGYFTFTQLGKIREDFAGLREPVIKVSGLCLVFLLVLSPYWSTLLFESSGRFLDNFVASLNYDLGSFEGLMTTFVYGIRGSHRGALFVQGGHFNLFLIVLLLGLAEWLILGREFGFRKRYGYLLATALGLWGLAHLLHPLLYQPFKYTRLCLPLALAFPAMENLPETIRRLRRFFTGRVLLRWMVYAISFLGGLLYCQHWVAADLLPRMSLLTHLGADLREFILVLPIVLGLAIVMPKHSDTTMHRCVWVVLLLAGLVFFPAGSPEFVYRGLKLSDLGGLFTRLRQSPPGSMVAGPVDVMYPIAAFGQRPVYNATDWRAHNFLCERNEVFWSAYFASQASGVRRFLEENGIRFLLVDRQVLARQDFFGAKGCIQTFASSIDTSNPYLHRHFEDAYWRLGRRLYLIGPRHLRGAP